MSRRRCKEFRKLTVILSQQLVCRLWGGYFANNRIQGIYSLPGKVWFASRCFNQWIRGSVKHLRWARGLQTPTAVSRRVEISDTKVFKTATEMDTKSISWQRFSWNPTRLSVGHFKCFGVDAKGLHASRRNHCELH